MPAYLTQAYHSLKVQGQTKDIMSLVEVVTCICDIYTWSIYSRWTYLLRMFHHIEDLLHPLEIATSASHPSFDCMTMHSVPL